MTELPVSAIVVLLAAALRDVGVEVIDEKDRALLIEVGGHKFMIGVQECE